MSPSTYFRGCLFLPLLLPIFIPRSTDFGSLLWASLQYGGYAYAVLGLALFYWIGKLNTTKSILKLAIITPILFIPVQWIFYFIYINPELLGDWPKDLPLFSILSLVGGYMWVTIVLSGYFILSKFSYVNNGV